VSGLRGQVRELSEENQAFVFRIKQLEDFAVQQQGAMTQLKLLLEQVQHKQQAMAEGVAAAAAAAAGGGGGNGGVGGDGVGFSSDGGWYNPGYRTPPRADSLRDRAAAAYGSRAGAGSSFGRSDNL
jgi:hypothetical protein